jgi:hypothetical protein
LRRELADPIVGSVLCRLVVVDVIVDVDVNGDGDGDEIRQQAVCRDR